MEKTQNNTKKPIDYSKGKIYKIVCDTTKLVYIGSTIQKLCERLRGHRADYKSYLKGKGSFTTSFDIIKNNNYQIILIDECPCNNKEQLLREERKYIENIECVNKIIPTRTKKEHYQDNKEQILERNKEYYENNKEKRKEYRENNKEKISEKGKEYRENNKEKILERMKEYYENNKEKRKEYRENNKEKISEKGKEYREKNKEKISERIKEYRENNKDKITDKNKEYRENNKEKIREQKKKTIQCEFCNSTSTLQHLKRHQRTNKCQKFQLSI